MNVRLKPISSDSQKEIIDIFNYYVENSYAAYVENKVPYEFFNKFQEMFKGYPAVVAEDDNGGVLGFGMLRAYNPMPTFSHVAEITTFIKHGLTGKGVGQIVFEYLEKEGKNRGITSILASISSLNDVSEKFHAKNGFIKCGQFKNVCKKKNTTFDVIYMQKMI